MKNRGAFSVPTHPAERALLQEHGSRRVPQVAEVIARPTALYCAPCTNGAPNIRRRRRRLGDSTKKKYLDVLFRHERSEKP